MIRFFITFLILLFSVSSSFALEDVFNSKVDTEKIDIDAFRDVECKFEQEKILSSSPNVIKSGGDFKFVLKKGVIFETLYPIKYTTSYTSKENKYVNDIIVGISKRNFSHIEKNFNTYFKRQDNNWILGLIPKEETPVSLQLKNIIIVGEKDINKIIINTVNNGSTKINFSQCK